MSSRLGHDRWVSCWMWTLSYRAFRRCGGRLDVAERLKCEPGWNANVTKMGRLSERRKDASPELDASRVVPPFAARMASSSLTRSHATTNHGAPVIPCAQFVHQSTWQPSESSDCWRLWTCLLGTPTMSKHRSTQMLFIRRTIVSACIVCILDRPLVITFIV